MVMPVIFGASPLSASSSTVSSSSSSAGCAAGSVKGWVYLAKCNSASDGSVKGQIGSRFTAGGVFSRRGSRGSQSWGGSKMLRPDRAYFSSPLPRNSISGQEAIASSSRILDPGTRTAGAWSLNRMYPKIPRMASVARNSNCSLLIWFMRGHPSVYPMQQPANRFGQLSVSLFAKVRADKVMSALMNLVSSSSTSRSALSRTR